MNTKTPTPPLQHILENLHSAIMVVDGELCIEYMNPSAEMMFSISSARAHGKSLHELIANEPEFFDRLERSLVTSHPYAVYEANLTSSNGYKLAVDYMVSPLEYGEDNDYMLIEYVSMGRHRKIAQEEHLLSQHEASRSLLRGLAHEIKNPLGGLRGAAQLLERKLKTDADKEYTNIIIREADRLQNLVDRMLGPSNLPQKNYVNIHKLLEHTQQLVQAENPGLVFELDYDPSLPDIFADESMIIQALLNITRNAVAAVNEHGIITYRTRARRNYAIGHHSYALVAQIDIIDNGEGIPDDIREKIFLPMVTSRADGTGLGLSIAQSLINQHNGLIDCQSEPGNTVFSLLLPLENGHE
jgi:two-component system nitrogen regulation sensor histidine kinase GlnL